MRKVPLVFCLLRNPQPLLPKIWKLHLSNTEKHWQLLRLAMNVNFPTPWITPTRFLAHHWHPKGCSCLSAVCGRHATDYCRVPSRTHRYKFNVSLETTWRGTTKRVVPRNCSRCVGSHTVEYGTEVSLLPMCVILVCLTRQFQSALCMISFKYRCRNFYISQYIRRFQCIVNPWWGDIFVIGNMNGDLIIIIIIIIMVRYWLNVMCD